MGVWVLDTKKQMSCHAVRDWWAQCIMPKRTQEQKEAFEAKKRAKDDCIPAGVRLKHDVDAMGCLILAVTKDNRDLHEKVAKARLENDMLQRQLNNTNAYVNELELRMEALERVIKTCLVGTSETVGLGVMGVIHDVTQSGDAGREDLERLIEESGLQNDFEVMEGWEDWFMNESDEL